MSDSGRGWGIKRKKFLTAVQPEAQNMRRAPHHSVTSLPLVIILPLIENTRCLPGAHMQTYVAAYCLCSIELLLNNVSTRSSNIATLKWDEGCRFFHSASEIFNLNLSN